MSVTPGYLEHLYRKSSADELDSARDDLIQFLQGRLAESEREIAELRRHAEAKEAKL